MKEVSWVVDIDEGPDEIQEVQTNKVEEVSLNIVDTEGEYAYHKWTFY